MKKFLILAVALMFVLAFAVACGSDDDDEATPSPTPADTTPADTTPADTTPADTTPDPVDDEEEEEEGPVETGVNAGFVRDGGGGSGLDLIIGSGTDVWPFANSQEYGGRAFDPVPGSTIRITYNVTSDDATGWRVRWMTSGYGYPTYTAGDGAVVNDFPVEPGEVATVIPAHFTFGAERGDNFDLVLEITLDEDQGYNELIGNITLRGTAGSSEWFANSMTVELLEGGPGSDVAELLVEWER
jgi:ABC-type glycerol-3-phosphate transport system substrate-binding protein